MNEEKYIKNKLSDYESPMDMDQMWSQLSAGLDSDPTGDDESDQEVDTEQEEVHIKEQLTDHESEMDMDTLWSKLDIALDTGATSTVNTISAPIAEKKNKLFPLLLLLLLSSGLAIYGALQWKSSAQNKSLQSSESQIKSNYKTDIGTIDKTTTSISATDEQVNQSINIEDDTKSPAAVETINNKVKSKQNSLRKSEPVSPAKGTDRKTSNNSIKSDSRKANTSSPTIPGSADHFIKKSTLPVTKVPDQAEIKKPLAIKLPVLSNTGGGMILDDQNVSLNPLATLGDKTILPLQYTDQHSYNPQIAKTNQSKPFWRLGLNTGINKANSKYNPLTGLGLVFEQIQTMNIREQPNFNLALGLTLERVFDSGLKLGTGLNYYNHGSSFESRNLINEEILNEEFFGDQTLTYNATGQVISIQEVERTVEKTYQISKAKSSINTFQIPLMLGYELGYKKFDVSASVGLGINYFYNNSGYGYDNSISTLDESFFQLNSSYLKLSGLAEIQFGYKISDKFRLYSKLVGGKFNDDVSAPAIEGNNIYSASLNHFGLKAGLSYIL